MDRNSKIIEVVFGVIDGVNDTLPADQSMTKSLETILFGEGSTLNSLGLVQLVIGVEAEIEVQLGVPIALADNRAMSQERSPFRTVATLVDYVAMLLDEVGIE